MGFGGAVVFTEILSLNEKQGQELECTEKSNSELLDIVLVNIVFFGRNG